MPVGTEDYLVAVQRNGRALLRVPSRLRTPEICMLAVQQDGRACERERG